MNKPMYFAFWLALGYNQKWLPEIDADCDSSKEKVNNETRSLDVYLYSITTISTTTPNREDFELWNKQTYGALVMSQTAIPGEKVPVWAVIEEHLKDVDRYITAVENVISDLGTWCDGLRTNYGASGILKLHNGTTSPSKWQLLYSWDTESQRMVPIPKFIYRFIQGEAYYNPYGRNSDGTLYHNAVVIIHNDPTTGSDDDRLDCERCCGWSEIENTYTEPALTYVCLLNKEIAKILGIDDYNPAAKPLDLTSVAYSYSEHPNWDFTFPLGDGDQTQNIYEKYKSLKECC